MKEELPGSKPNATSLDARFAKRPHAYARLRQIADMMDQALAEGCTAPHQESEGTAEAPVRTACG